MKDSLDESHEDKRNWLDRSWQAVADGSQLQNLSCVFNLEVSVIYEYNECQISQNVSYLTRV